MFGIQQCDVLVIARMSPRRETRTRRLIRALTDDFTVQVVSEYPDGASGQVMHLDGAWLDEIKLPFPRVHSWYFTGWLRVIYFNLYATLVALQNPDSIVVCSDSIYCLAGLVSKLFLRRKFVYNSHEIMWGLGNHPILSRFMGWLEKIAIKFCDFWLVPSEERARIILEKHKITKNYVVYENFPMLDGFVSQDSIQLRAQELAHIAGNRPVVMFQGSVTHGRGLEELIRSARSAEFHVMIQGSGRLLEDIRKTKNRNVDFLEACSNTETVAWLAAAQLSFVYYENNCMNSAYACSSKFYTSVFAGVPIICNRLPAFKSFADKYGGVMFFDTLDSVAVEACINAALNPKSYARLKEEIQLACRDLQATALDTRISRAFLQLKGEGLS